MIRLLGAELNRLRSRRMTLVSLLAVVAALGLFQIVVAVEMSPPTAAEIAQNRQYYQESVSDWEENHEEWEQECLDEAMAPAECTFPRPTEADFGISAVPFAEVAPAAVQTAVYLGGLAMFLIAASFIGAEFSTGSIGNWLSFVPQRGRVYASKLVAVLIAAVLVSAVASALTIGVTALQAAAWGVSLDGLSAVIATAGRGIIAAVIFGVVGFCVGLLTRHTAAAIGVFLGYLFVTFVRAVPLMEFEWAARLTRWTPEGNLSAILAYGYRYEIYPETVTTQGSSYEPITQTISFGAGLGYWAVLLALLVVGSLLVFRRRDVS